MSMGELGSLGVPVVLMPEAFDRGLASIRGRMQSFAASIARLTRSMVLPSLGGGLAGGYLIKQAADLESSFTTLARTTGLGGDRMAKFQGEVKKLATELSGVKLDDILAISAIGGRMGIQGAALSRFTRDISMVRVALSDIPAEEAVNGISRILNVFNLGSENAIRFASALNKLDMASTATGRDILAISTRIAPAAAILGMTPQKVMALSAALKDAGARSEVAGTAISQVLGLMAKKTSEFARASGVSTKTFAETLRADPLEALKLLAVNIEKMDKLKAFSALEGLGLDGQRTTMTLLQLTKVLPKLEGFVADANSEWSSTASILESVRLNSETTHAQLQRLSNRVRLLAAEAGTHLLPVVKALADSFGPLATRIEGAIAGNAGRFRELTAAMIQGGATVGSAYGSTLDNLRIGLEAVRERLAELPAHLATALGPEATATLSRFGEEVSRFASDYVHYFNDMAAGVGKAIRNLPLMLDIAVLKMTGGLVEIGAEFEHLGAGAAAVGRTSRTPGSPPSSSSRPR